MDYNIYIRSIGAQSDQSPTKPWTSGKKAETVPWKREGVSTETPTELVHEGWSLKQKALVGVAAAIAVAKAATAVYDTALEFHTVATGDYALMRDRRNFKTTLSNLFHPASAALNFLKAEQAIAIEDQKRSMRRELLGGTIVNGEVGV